MSEAARLDPAVTIAAFDAFLDAQQDDQLWELVAGDIVAMTNPTETHEQGITMDGRGCRAYQGGMRIQRSDATSGLDKPRPDVLVRCGPFHGRTYVTDPMVVIEVLSPSTIDSDRGNKLRFYKTLPTLRHIALVYQEQMRIEHYVRTDEGWRIEILTRPDERLRLDAVGFELPLARVYFGVPAGIPDAAA